MDNEKKKNSQRLAFPTNGRMHPDAMGLTKREYFAAMALQGFLSAWPEHAGNITPTAASLYAVSCADELLKALEL